MPLSLLSLILIIAASLGTALYFYLAERSRRAIVERSNDRTVGIAVPVFGHAPTVPDQIAHHIASVIPQTWVSAEDTETELVQAGYDGETAPLLYAATRVVLAVGLPLLTLLLVPKRSFNILLLDAGCAVIVALLLPPWFLMRKVRMRQQRIRRSLPDALDLLVVCIEAGISLDAALLRVARDLDGVHPELSDELLVVTQKSNVGMPRADALRGLWTRTGVEEIRALVSHIVQAEKWGTSSGKVLRVYAETLRRQRRQTAEKKAATAPVKMLIPLGLFIFPALMLVIMGPIVINVMTLFSKK